MNGIIHFRSMDTIYLEILNVFFFVFHGALILFNLFGWIHPRTRKWNLLTLLATGASWFILGIWYGWGYCPCTDWHWQVRRALDLPIETNSYIDFLLMRLLGLELPIEWVDAGTLIVFLLALVLSIVLNVKGRQKT